MAIKNFNVTNKDTTNMSMTILIPENIINKLERSQDEYARKVGDCSILLTDKKKTVTDPIFFLEFEHLVELCKVWQSNKDCIRDEFVLPAIEAEFGYDTLHADSAWQILYNRTNECQISNIKKVSRDILYTGAGYTDAIAPVATNDFSVSCINDIYNDIMDRDLANDKNIENIRALSALRTEYSMKKTTEQNAFFEKHVVPILNKEFSAEDIAKLTWECSYISGELKIYKSEQ